MKFVILIFLTAILLLNPVNTKAQETECKDRYLTLINPVRSREVWLDKDLTHILNQYEIIKANNFPATWLIQYDVLSDFELLGLIKSFDPNQEKGVFLEVSENLARDARVSYPVKTPWFKPNAVFLSGYSQSERRKMINKLFAEFKEKFGTYPKSVGAWWIDSYSLEYLKQEFGITAAMIVADQKTTDSYGVWGQWWGIPYYPSKANILTPASNTQNKQDVVILQWAQRDPLLAYGEGPLISNFSLQANDYIRQGKTTEYFKEISDAYLDCSNPLGQITVGLESGIESIGYIDEYKKQLEYLKQKPGLQSVTMSQFAKKFAEVYPETVDDNTISHGDSIWNLSTKGRANQKLNDSVFYHPESSFSDYFVEDNAEFLNRRLDHLEKGNTKFFIPFYLLIIIGTGIFFSRKKKLPLFIFGLLFLLSAYGLLLRSYSKYGWNVYYGPVVENIQLVQIFICLIAFIIIFFLSTQKKFSKFDNKLFLNLVPFSFGLNFLFSKFRFSNLENVYYLGFGLDALRFLGISISKNFDVLLINRDFEGYQLQAFLKFSYEKIWENNFLALVIFPLTNIVIALGLYFLLRKLNKKARIFILAVLVLLWIGYILQVFSADPRVVLINS